jgi:hypothetical protein
MSDAFQKKMSSSTSLVAEMERMIWVYNSSGEKKAVTVSEAEKIIQATFDDNIGGLVVDMRTQAVIWEISPEVEKIIIVQMLGGG